MASPPSNSANSGGAANDGPDGTFPVRLYVGATDADAGAGDPGADARPPFVAVHDSGVVLSGFNTPSSDNAASRSARDPAAAADATEFGATVILAVDGTASMHSNMPFVREMLIQMVPQMWATGRRVVLVNWAARKIAHWDVPCEAYETEEAAQAAVRVWLDEVVKRVMIVEGHYEEVTRLRVGGRTDIWGSLFQVFGLAREIRATRGATHEVSVMMLTDGEHNELAVPKWWTGPPPVDGNFPLGTYVHRPDAGWVKSPSNRCTLDGGLARVVPPNTPVTFIGIKDAKTAEIERINHVVSGRLMMVSNLEQLGEAFDADFGGHTQAGLEHSSGLRIPFVREDEEDGACRAVGAVPPTGIPKHGELSLTFGAAPAVELKEQDPAGIPAPPAVALVMEQLAGCEKTVADLMETQPPFNVERIHAASVAAERKVQCVLRSLPRMRKATIDALEPHLAEVRAKTGEVDARRRAEEMLRKHGHGQAHDNSPSEDAGADEADREAVAPAAEPSAASTTSELRASIEAVSGLSADAVDSVMGVFSELGVTSIPDLEFVSQDDIANCNITVIQKRKLMAAFAKLVAGGADAVDTATSVTPTDSATPSSACPLNSAASILSFFNMIFEACEIWSCDLLARCRGLLKALSVSLEGAHKLEHSTDLTMKETERLLGNLQAMSMPTRRARKLVQFLDNLKAATTPIVATLLRRQGDPAVVAQIDSVKGRGYKVEVVSRRYDGGDSRFVWERNAVFYTFGGDADEDNCCVCLEAELVANFDYRCEQCRTFLHKDCRRMLSQRFGNNCVVCRTGNWVRGDASGAAAVVREPIFCNGYPAVAVAMGYTPDTLVHEPGLFSVLQIPKDSLGAPLVLDMGDVWTSMRGAGTVPGDQLSSSTVEILPVTGSDAVSVAPPSSEAAAAAAAAPGPGSVTSRARAGPVVNAVLPLAFDDATYHAFKWRGLLYASAINSTGSLWALIPVHRMFPQAAIQFYLHGELELALQMVASYKKCFDDTEYPDPRFQRGPIGQLSPTEPIGNGKNHSPGLLVPEAMCRWIVRGGRNGRSAAAPEPRLGVVDTIADALGVGFATEDNGAPAPAAPEVGAIDSTCGLCSAEFAMSSNFQGQSPRCPACRASGVEWKQAWLTTVWFRSLGLSLGNKPHTEAPPAMKMAVRVRLWALQAAVRDALDLPDFKIRTFATALSDEQKLGVAEQVEAFLYDLYALVLQPLDGIVKTGWTQAVQLAQWAVAVHSSINDIMTTFETSCHANVAVEYKGFHLPAVAKDGGLVELRDLPAELKGPLVTGMFCVFLNHDVPPRDGVVKAAEARVNLRDVELGPRIKFEQAYDPDEAADNPVIVVLGAGDHGKSTLLGSTFASQMNPDVVEKYTEMMKAQGKEELAFAWLSDLSKHERYRGCTSKPHYWNFHTGTRQCALIDVPGQAKYLKSAYIGMAAADAAIVVISAVPSEHEPALKVGGQAWNHCMATKSMVGISRYIIAITKMDLIDFSKDAFDELCTKVQTMLKKMGITDACFVPLSGLKSENIFAPSAAMPWTRPDGGAAAGAAAADAAVSRVPTLLEAIDQLPISRAEQLTQPFRLMVDTTYKIKGVGDVVCGVVTSGTAKVGDDVVWDRPDHGGAHLRGTIRSIEHFHKPADSCKAGDMVGVSIRVDQNAPNFRPPGKGDVIGPARAPPTYGNILDLVIFVTAKQENVKVGSKPVLVLGTSRVNATIVAVAAEVSSDNKVRVQNPAKLERGKHYLVQFHLAHPVPAETRDKEARYSRAILMIGNLTWAIGRVETVRDERDGR